MRILLFLVVMNLTHQGFATEKLSNLEIADRASLSIRFSNYALKTPTKIRNTILADMQKLGTLELTEKNDLELVKNALLTLILIDKMDIPRAGLSNLADSYEKNKTLYKKAALLIQTEKNKKLMTELLETMDSFDENGNG